MDRYQTDQAVAAQLDPGEGLLWSGSPSPGRMALSAVPAMVFGIPFGGFAAYWIFMAYQITSKSKGPDPSNFFPLFGIPFLLIGLGMLTAPLWAYLSASRTQYALTSKRALIVSNYFTLIVRSFTYEEMGEVQRLERAGGEGDLFFAQRAVVTRRGATVLKRVGFLGIPDVRSVEQMIRSRLHQQAA
jgi:hypothetical protein